MSQRGASPRKNAFSEKYQNSNSTHPPSVLLDTLHKLFFIFDNFKQILHNCKKKHSLKKYGIGQKCCGGGKSNINLMVGNMGLHHCGAPPSLVCGCLSVHHHFRPITHTQEPTKMAFYCFLNIPIRTPSQQSGKK